MKRGQVLVNDVHSRLNPTCVRRIVMPRSLDALCKFVRDAWRQGETVCVAGGRHAMGAQQFGNDALLIDTRRLNRVLHLDPLTGVVESEAGIRWPELVRHLISAQRGAPRPWGIAQKQTGADQLSLGGALAANIHGRGLRMRPLIADVESFVLVDAHGNIHTCSRNENAERFRLVIGGYGLFGIVYSIRLRLCLRQKVRRVVEVIRVEDLMSCFEQRIRDGFLYGDFQYLTDARSDDFLRKGVFSCYQPVDPSTPVSRSTRRYTRRDWLALMYLAHTDKEGAFQRYVDYYLGTSGRVYWSDTHQLSQLGGYIDGYHRHLDRRKGAADPASEIITEIFVPRSRLIDFLDEVRADFRAYGVNVIYGTIRLVERDDESFLAWAKEPCAGVIFNLHTVHTPEGIAHSAHAFRRLTDLAIRRGGSYYLTYHKYATRTQVAACYPQFAEFLRLKKHLDPDERFQSDWYRHHRALFAQA